MRLLQCVDQMIELVLMIEEDHSHLDVAISSLLHHRFHVAPRAERLDNEMEQKLCAVALQMQRISTRREGQDLRPGNPKCYLSTCGPENHARDQRRRIPLPVEIQQQRHLHVLVVHSRTILS